MIKDLIKKKIEDSKSLQLGSIVLTEEEMKKYARHMVLPEVGEEGQKKLKDAKVLIVGVGGLGSPVALYLAATGIGCIGLVDSDLVEETNLQRQIIYSVGDVGKNKVESAKQRLLSLNPNVKINAYPGKLTKGNAEKIIKDYDIVVDGSDNLETRYVVNDACLVLGKPFVYGSIYKFEGQISLFNYKNGPCYRCLQPEMPKANIPTCVDGGVLGILPGIVGSFQANEVIKVILSIGETLSGRLLLFDSLSTKLRELRLNKDEKCICSGNWNVGKLVQPKQGAESSQGILDQEKDNNQITVQELKRKMGKGDIQLLDVREKFECNICHISGAKHIPMGQIEDRISELEKNKEVIVYCHHGGRSQQVCLFLQDNGFKAKNLLGGIDSWAEEIEPEMDRY